MEKKDKERKRRIKNGKNNEGRKRRIKKGKEG